MKNEWDLLAEIQRRLAAGASLITIQLDIAEDEGRGVDDSGQVYALGPDFNDELFPFLRSLNVSFRLRGAPASSIRTLDIGQGLAPNNLSGTVDFMALGILPSEYFGITPQEPDDTEHGEEWKRLL
ncbi:hypothetical protein [Hymenobacter terrenus]|uniref:hypothetical protein n=1 Tax=Hymenobacter terrenus TaxID=1629124 RepID=UPI00061A00EC|nr:hypothetical protein [Hymenobacter terrenus]